MASPFAITLAILPEVEYGPQIAKDAGAQGKEVIMHLPMEKALDMPGTIYTWMGEQQIRDLLAADINDVPGAVGINNHMGVSGTSDPATMRVVMSFVRERGLFFVDSGVTGSSVVSQMAAEQGMPALVRDVFLDHEEGLGYIRGALNHLRGIALEKGFAIGIGHIRSEGIINLINEAAAAWAAEGILLVPVSHLLHFVRG
ncbi:MAG: divergent polysaccharide deacetylase family protein [Coprothermobacterota bacterium]|nr:divergent polysaccharide deacetylase family protein [Coprothermobacterota bacterium]